MSSNNLTPSFRYPATIPEDAAHPTVRKAIGQNVKGIVDLNQAIAALKTKLDALTTTSTSSGSITTTNIINGGSSFTGLGTWNDQSGVTAYTTTPGDNGVLLVVSDASPVAVTLSSAVSTPYFFFITNFGAGTATLTPDSGTIDGGASVDLLEHYFAMVIFNGTNWQTSDALLAKNTPLVTHNWLDSYDSSTGLFGQSQPSFSDVSGLLDVSQLPADVPVVSFGAGAPGGSASEGYLYFDTTLATYAGYVWHSGVWNPF